MPDFYELLHCAHCAGEGVLEEKLQYVLPYRIFCSNSVCGMSTPNVKLATVAITIWNRRPKRKPPIRSRRKGIRNS